jgi:hypothetical protein
MLPVAFESPAAIGLVLGGAISCFAGYRWFRIVLAIYGFIAGAMIASSSLASSNTTGLIGAALVGGVIGAVLLFFAYFVGIALVGAGLGVFLMQTGWSRYSTIDPPWALVLLFAVLGTVAALVLQRYVIVVVTAFAGAWTIVIGALALVGDRRAVEAASDVWILYPSLVATHGTWVPLAWVALGILGLAVQLATTGSGR